MANTFSFEDASTPLDGGTGPSNAFSFEEAAMAPAKPSGLVRRALGDTAVSLGKGVVGAGESLVGLADLATGGLAGKALNKATGYDPKATKAAFDELYSPEQQAANKAVREADGFIPTLGALARNPSAILQSVAESAPSIVGAGGGAQLLGKAGILAKNALARGAISEGLFGAGQQAEQFRQDNPDGTLSARQELASLGSGAGTAAFAGIGGKVAQKLGIADLDTVLAGGKVPTAAAKQGLARRVGEGFVSEGALEEMPQSAWEQMAQNFGNAKPLTEGVGSAAATGLVVGGVMGGGMGAASRSMSGAEKPGEQPAPSQPTDAPIPYTPTTVAEVAQQRNEAMGIDPAAGPLSAVASMAVESQTAEEIRLSTPQILAEGAQAAERARAEQEARMQAEPGIPFEPVPIQGAAAQVQPDVEVPFVDPQIPVQDWINQQTGVGQSAGVTRQDFVSASKEKTDPQIILDESGRPTTTDNLLDIQQFNADRERREALRARNLEAGNRLKSAKTAAQEREEGSPVELIPLSPTQLIQSGGRLDGRNIVNEQGEVMLPNLNIQQYREALQALEESGQSGRPAPARGKNAQGSRQVPGAAPSIALSTPNIAAQAPGMPAAAPNIPQEAPNGATRPDPAEVAAGRDPQGSVDARGMVDPGADEGGRAAGQGNGRDAAQPAAGVPGAGAGVGVRPADQNPIKTETPVSAGLASERAAPNQEPAKKAKPQPASLERAVQILNDRTDGVGSPDGLAGAENARARAEIVSALTGESVADLEASPNAAFRTSVLQVEKLLHEAAGIKDSGLRARREKFLDWLDGRDAGKSAPSIEGTDLGGGWFSFRPESGTVGVPRAEMPQIKAEHRGAMVNFMNARGVQHQEEAVPAASLKPTQAEFSREKVERAKAFDGGDRSILVSADNHVLDGHHQWMAARDKGDDVKVIRLDAPIRDLVGLAHDFPSSTTADGAKMGAEAAPETLVEKSRVNVQNKQESRATAGVGAGGQSIESLFSDLDSTFTRKRNKARRAAAKHPQAARIEYVQENFHDLLMQMMDAGVLEVNGTTTLTEESASCL